MTTNHYNTLGVDRKADKEEIKKAYRELSKVHHPDHGGDEEKFKEISEAYSVLSNHKKRAEYDNPNPFGNMFEGFGFPGARPFRRRDPNAPRQGRHIKLEHAAPIHMFVLGGDLKVSFSFGDDCKECDGKGATDFDECELCNGTGMITRVQTGPGMHIQSSAPCPDCHGQGRAPKNKCEACSGNGTVKIDREEVLPIPPGFRDGQVAGAAGRGGRGVNGGPPGDLMVKLWMKYPKAEELTDEQKEILEEI